MGISESCGRACGEDEKQEAAITPLLPQAHSASNSLRVLIAGVYRDSAPDFAGGFAIASPTALEPSGAACYKRTGAVRRARRVARRLRSNTMAQITLRVLDGADRGRVFDELATPVTIGREEGNSLQLNDERVSRFHVKIQEDQDKIVLTDLESTNGTKVNGEDIQLRILRFGDIISLGRSVLLFGSREQIAGRLAALRSEMSGTIGVEDRSGGAEAGSLDFELNWSADPDVQSTLHTLVAPDLPERLSPGQAAQLCELLEYLHVRIRDLLASVAIKPDADQVTLEAAPVAEPGRPASPAGKLSARWVSRVATTSSVL